MLMSKPDDTGKIPADIEPSYSITARFAAAKERRREFICFPPPRVDHL